jgi:hypothetical protein
MLFLFFIFPKAEVTWKTYKQKENIKINLKEIDCENVDWIHLAEHGEQWRTHMNEATNFRVP